jgi:AcrR family transcriptional regulator
MTPDAPVHDPRNDRILAAAKVQFAAHGFEKAKLASIAQAADVAVGTVYLRYPGKTDLLAAVLRQTEAGFVAALTNPDLRKIPWPERFGAIFTAVFNVARLDASLPGLMALVPFVPTSDTRPGDTVRKAIAIHLAEGQREGAFRSGIDVTISATIAHAMVEGAMYAMFADPTLDPGRVMSHLTDASRRWLMA